MKPNELVGYLNKLVEDNILLSAMVWGAPGIGKSSIVHQVADAHSLDCIDLRLSQLAPTDLRGLPVPRDDKAVWLSPEFLPREGKGILFLDEINMAPPALQGVAQQLILDRRVGRYSVPEGWFVWAAGNRKEDRAAVFDMPLPLANRFIHLEIEVCPEDFRQYAYAQQVDAQLIAFVTFREDLLHKMHEAEVAWPSPRSWVMADALHRAGLSIAPAVGLGPASEFEAYLEIMQTTPDLDRVIEGKPDVAFPDEVSLRYASVMGLVARCKTPEHAINSFRWLIARAPAEWIQLFATDLFPLLRVKDLLEPVHHALMNDPELREFLSEFSQLLAYG
ncbi:MAG: MoxR family ATPase [Candidatus Thiodiazotropha sp. (ex Monitilora ramsayi)]|nr:MoxR family ATPase [Candidatus Thiodiazotropha sp. (ex Monitilora ramsayi)]